MINMLRKTILSGLAISGFCVSHLQAQGLRITKLTDHFYVYTTWHDQLYMRKSVKYPANGMYVTTDSGALLIDTPWDSTMYQALEDSIMQRHHMRIRLCIATHAHDDRTGGLSFYESHGVPTWTSNKTDSVLAVRHLHRPQHTFSTDTFFVFGAKRFQVIYPGPGHTIDNIVIWFASDKILYGGCFIKSTDAVNLGHLTDALVNQWGQSLQHVSDLCPNPRFVIPGHLSWKSRKSIAHTKKLVKKELK